MSDFDDGMAVRREVLGDEHVDGATVNDVTADFQELITRYAWGGVWTRPGLSRRDRSIGVLTALVAGAADPVATPAACEKMAAAVPGADLVVVPDTSHIATVAGAPFLAAVAEHLEAHL